MIIRPYIVRPDGAGPEGVHPEGVHPDDIHPDGGGPDGVHPHQRDARRHNRRSTRLQGYDYGQEGAYFVTIVTRNRVCLFGEVVDGEMRLNAVGQATQECWLSVPRHYPYAGLDTFVVMPNHIHGIIVIRSMTLGADDDPPSADDNPSLRPAPPQRRPAFPPRSPSPAFRSPSRTLGAVVRGFKIGVAKWLQANPVLVAAQAGPAWQRNYYDHIIRDEAALNRIRRYIIDNPLRWASDAENPNRHHAAP